MGIGYSVNPDPDRTSKALGKELAIKPRDSIEVCRAIRGMKLEAAKELLEDVIEKKRAIPYRRHNRWKAHQKGTGPGGYPKKATQGILKVIEEAEANAEYKGLEPEELWISHAAAQRAGEIPGSRPRARGRATDWNQSLTHIEIVLEERKEDL